MAPEIQEPLDVPLSEFFEKKTKMIKNMAPEIKRMLVNMAGSIALSFKAILQIIELPAKAIRANTV